ncbi:MAG: hypothetical protein JJU36_10045 [Phycisphaeraceae bacterium]|nr:hypothetical protein [Phycisphaeraceae bacterium]
MPNHWRLVVWPEAEGHGSTDEPRAELEPHRPIPETGHGAEIMKINSRPLFCPGNRLENKPLEFIFCADGHSRIRKVSQ